MTNEWKTVGVGIKSQDLPALNQRLRLYGFETLGQLVGDFLIAKFPPILRIDKFRQWIVICKALA